MKKITFFYCMFIANYAAAQDINPPMPKEKDVGYILESSVDSLQRNKVDTIITVMRIVEGGAYDPIGIPTAKCYIFWSLGSNTYFQELSGYTNHDVVKSRSKVLAKTDIFYFLNSNYDSLKGDFILPFIYKFKRNNIECYDLMEGIHGAYNTISIYTKDAKFSKGIDDLHLKDSLGDETVNINSTHNNQTKLKKFWYLLWDIIKKEREQ